MAESDSTASSDVLQLGELLTGAGAGADNLVAYLSFAFDPQTNATVVELASQPEAAESPAKIILTGVNLTTLGTHGSDILSCLLSSNSHISS